MLSIYEILGQKYLTQFISVLKHLIIDERLIDSIISWYNSKESFISKDELLMILTYGMKYPGVRSLISEGNLRINEDALPVILFTVPNYTENNLLTKIFNLALQSSINKDIVGVPDEIFIARKIYKDKKSLKQWTWLFRKSFGVDNEVLDIMLRLSNEKFLFLYLFGAKFLIPLYFLAGIFSMVSVYSKMKVGGLSKLLDKGLSSGLPYLLSVGLIFLFITSLYFALSGNRKMRKLGIRIKRKYSNRKIPDLFKIFSALFLSVYFIFKVLKKALYNYSTIKFNFLFAELKKIKREKLRNLWFFDIEMEERVVKLEEIFEIKEIDV
jgi:hypothetical protein